MARGRALPARGTSLSHGKLPLGRDSGYPQKYAPEALCPIARADSRSRLGISAELPFSGVDIWNAWELTWLGAGRKPVAATAEILVPADSPNIIESKSLKLYLNSFAMTNIDSADDIARIIATDLGVCADTPVTVRIDPITHTEGRSVSRLAGRCLDTLDVSCDDWDVNADLLSADSADTVGEDLYTHLLRSLCPVTDQPDSASLQISYRGPRIDHAGLLRYIVSFRQHNDFHESCVERMFVDILARCEPQELSLHARYQRRGGIDINPFRSTSRMRPRNLRLWRQ